MTRKDLYELEKEVHESIAIIRSQQAEFLRGVEKGIDLMFSAVRKYLAKEEYQAEEGGAE